MLVAVGEEQIVGVLESLKVGSRARLFGGRTGVRVGVSGSTLLRPIALFRRFGSGCRASNAARELVGGL